MKAIRLSNKKWNEIKKALILEQWNSTNAYQELMKTESLFGYAFFGWAASKYQRSKMRAIWLGILFVQLEDNKNLANWQRNQIKSELNIRQ